ncbi:MAG: SoxR reducing system RseC family protein [Calditrichaeota bacterium]|nr:SoxR reducing system RseC family protein [Calditrichota bacterium]
MEEEIGHVTKVDHGKVKVQLTPGSQCTGCGAKSFCSALGETVRVLEVESDENVSPGDKVSLKFGTSSKLTSAMIIFILPVIFMIAGYFLMTSLYINTEGWGIIGSLAGLVFGFIVIRILDRVLLKTKEYNPVIKKI